MPDPNPWILLVLVPVALVAIPKGLELLTVFMQRRRTGESVDTVQLPPRIPDPRELTSVSLLATAVRDIASTNVDLWRDLQTCKAAHENCTEKVDALEREMEAIKPHLPISPEMRQTLGIDPSTG